MLLFVLPFSPWLRRALAHSRSDEAKVRRAMTAP